VIDGKKVLVPQLILPEKDLAKYASITGGSILAENVFIQGDKVTNTGTILAANALASMQRSSSTSAASHPRATGPPLSRRAA
jgi:hypothetical protein